MKNLTLLTIVLLLTSCVNKKQKEEPLYPESKNPDSEVASGKELFEDVGNCASCHLPDRKVIGPSVQEIADIYKSADADMVAFLRGQSDPIVDPTQYEVMKTNFAITRKMSDAELKAIEEYMYSHASK
jgi:cytochrome c